LPGGTEEYHEKASVRIAGLRAEIWTRKEPPEYDAGVLTTRPRRSVPDVRECEFFNWIESRSSLVREVFVCANCS
jgi:hypothetical protein